MNEFKTFLHANNWNGKHLHRQMKKYAALVRRMGGSLNKTYREIAPAWTREDSKYWVRDRNIARVIKLYGQDDQRTAAWHSKRSEMITASEVGYIVEGTPSSRHEILMRKNLYSHQSPPASAYPHPTDSRQLRSRESDCATNSAAHHQTKVFGLCFEWKTKRFCLRT